MFTDPNIPTNLVEPPLAQRLSRVHDQNPTPIMVKPTNDAINLPDGDLDDGVVVLNDQANPKRQRKLTSKVWLDFDRVPKENKAVDAICKHCKTKMDGRSTSGTTHLKNHLKNCRKRKKPDIRQQLLSVKEENDGSTTVETFKFDQERSRLDLACMLIIHELPFAFVDYDGFRLFVYMPCGYFVKRILTCHFLNCDEILLVSWTVSL
ncbi:hypothetical protein IFM89_028895 [Coptis chinensis]|uniref:BED-type domain-containing protein n=1 Tax=Coptis chinensis TaxID=261450 RepID=A0A835HCA3_9MAGN|nr:hypothetical protein IFM89_028895 [Coptis chinensis]